MQETSSNTAGWVGLRWKLRPQEEALQNWILINAPHIIATKDCGTMTGYKFDCASVAHDFCTRFGLNAQ